MNDFITRSNVLKNLQIVLRTKIENLSGAIKEDNLMF